MTVKRPFVPRTVFDHNLIAMGEDPNGMDDDMLDFYIRSSELCEDLITVISAQKREARMVLNAMSQVMSILITQYPSEKKSGPELLSRFNKATMMHIAILLKDTELFDMVEEAANKAFGKGGKNGS